MVTVERSLKDQSELSVVNRKPSGVLARAFPSNFMQ